MSGHPALRPRRRRYVGVGIHIAEVDADYFEAFPLDPTERHAAHDPAGPRSSARVITVAAGHRRRVVDERPPAAAARADHRRRRRDRRRRPRHPRAAARAIPTSTGWPTRSTTWPTPCRPASSARPASPPTSATSCARRSPPWPPPPRSSTAAAASCPTAPSRRSTSSSARCAGSTPWSSTCSSCRASTPAPPTCTPRRSTSTTLCRRIAARDGFAEPADRRHRTRSGTNGTPPTAVRRPAALRAHPHQPARERPPPRRRPDAHLDRADRRAVPARRRRGRRPRRRPRRAGPHLRALRPRQRGPPPHRHRARPGPRRRARHGPGRRGVGRGPPGGGARFVVRLPDGAVDEAAACALVAGGRWRSLVVAASCGVGGDDKLRQINDDDLFGLDETTTSTTSTTTDHGDRRSPSVAADDRGTTTTIATERCSCTSSTATGCSRSPVDLAGAATPEPRHRRPARPGRRPGQLGIGLRTLLPSRHRRATARQLGRRRRPPATPPSTSRPPPSQLIDPADQRPAIAQIVLTLINRPGHRQVTLHARRRADARAARDGPAERARARRCPCRTTSRCCVGDVASTTTTTRPRRHRPRPRSPTVTPPPCGARRRLSTRRSTRSGRRCQSLSTFTRRARNVPSGSWARARSPDLLEDLRRPCR